MEESSISLLVEGVFPLTAEEMTYVPASDGRATPLATDGVEVDTATEKLPALCGGGYVLTRVGEPKDVHLQYVYFSCVYEFRGSRRRT